jgi:hypothetical protein
LRNGTRITWAIVEWVKDFKTQISGLLFDDLIPSEGELVTEAIRRLTPADQMERLFRIRRALNLSIKKQELPKDEWTTAAEVPFYPMTE